MSSAPHRPANLPRLTPAHVGERFVALCDVMAALRSPKGCPWDRSQSLQSLRKYVIEEAHEVADAIDALSENDQDVQQRGHCGELGDLLLQIVFQAQIQREAGNFDAGDVCDAIAQKMLRRHPHIFREDGSLTDVEGRDEAPSWEAIKAQERKDAGEEARSVVAGVPKSYPPLVRAMRSGERAHRVGFDWPDHHGVVAKIEEEIEEIKEALAHDDNAAVEAEIGDALYAIVNLCRHRGIDPGEALAGTVDRFAARFDIVERGLTADGLRPENVSLDELEARWQRAKREIAEETEGVST